MISAKDKGKVLEAIREGTIDEVAFSFQNLIDTLILTMKKEGILELLKNAFIDKRSDNMNIPFCLILMLVFVAKVKIKRSLTDLPSDRQCVDII